MPNNKSLIQVNSSNNVLEIYFVGNISDAKYRKIWYDSVYQAKINKIDTFFVDQSEVVSIPFSSRSWFLMDMLSLIRKELNNKIKVYINPSKDKNHSIVLKFMIKSIKIITKFNIVLVKDKAEYLELAKK